MLKHRQFGGVVFLDTVLDNLIFLYYIICSSGVSPQRNNEQKGRDMNKIIPAFKRQDEIKDQVAKEKAESQMRKYLIDLNDKNIPAVIRQQIRQEIEANPELQILVLKHQVQMFAEQNRRILAEVQKLNKSLGK